MNWGERCHKIALNNAFGFRLAGVIIRNMQLLYRFSKAIIKLAIAGVSVFIFFAAIKFPYHTDKPLTADEIRRAQKFYANAYGKHSSDQASDSDYDTRYIRIAAQTAKDHKIEGRIRTFDRRYDLDDKAVLEIGSGRGYLQDLVDDYTGIDISPTVKRFYHKKFVLGSATAMPFADNSFDGIWSIWVLEHVPNPEQALREARRVIRDQGVIYLYPAWNCTPWAAEGYEVRPYSDFGLYGKLVKASIPLRSWLPYRYLSIIPVRMVRTFTSSIGPTKLRYTRLTPNYEEYWTNDSDAINSIDIHEAALWFVTRGDECLNCQEYSVLTWPVDEPLIVRIHKQEEG